MLLCEKKNLKLGKCNCAATNKSEQNIMNTFIGMNTYYNLYLVSYCRKKNKANCENILWTQQQKVEVN